MPRTHDPDLNPRPPRRRCLAAQRAARGPALATLCLWLASAAAAAVPPTATVLPAARATIAPAFAPPAAAARSSPATGSAATPAPAPAPRRPAGVMSHDGADWLERASREREERPSQVIRALDLRPGDVVAEIGAGSGYMSRLLARAVGPTGKVYAEDIQPEMLAILERRAAAAGLANVVPVLGTELDPRLPAGAFRWVLLVAVYHEFQHPEAMLARIRQLPAPGGRVALVEYRAEGTSAAHIKPEHRMSVDQVLAEWLRAGFVLLKRIEDLPTQHLFVFTTRRGARAPL
jgi:predicted methyltransferase